MGSRWHKTSARTVTVKVASQMIIRYVMARVHATMALEVIRCEALWATVKHGIDKIIEFNIHNGEEAWAPLVGTYTF